MNFLKLLPILVVLFISCKTSKVTTETLKLSTFDYNQKQLITKGANADPMRLFLLTNPKDSLLLRQKSTMVDIKSDDPELDLFIDRLFATVRDSLSLGVGIAAPQVGILKNIIWVQRFDKPDFPFKVYLNPTIRQYSIKKQPCMEGCLSIPDKRGETQNRAYAILLEYDKRDGSHQIEMVEDFTAVIFQHEIDHLNGIMFTDHLEKEMTNK